MNNKYSRILLTAVFGCALAFGAPADLKREGVIEAKALNKMADDARTAAEHIEVAKQYRSRADAFVAKAEKLEREIAEQKAVPDVPLAHKWPAMVVNARERKERMAMQARRAAQESYALAERHMKTAADLEAGE